MIAVGKNCGKKKTAPKMSSLLMVLLLTFSPHIGARTKSTPIQQGSDPVAGSVGTTQSPLALEQVSGVNSSAPMNTSGTGPKPDSDPSKLPFHQTNQKQFFPEVFGKSFSVLVDAAFLVYAAALKGLKGSALYGLAALIGVMHGVEVSIGPAVGRALGGLALIAGTVFSLLGGYALQSFALNLKEDITGKRGVIGRAIKKLNDKLFGGSEEEEEDTDSLIEQVNDIRTAVAENNWKSILKGVLSLLTLTQSVTTDALVSGFGAAIMSASWIASDLYLQASIMTATITGGVMAAGWLGQRTLRYFENKAKTNLASAAQQGNITEEDKNKFINLFTRVKIASDVITYGVFQYFANRSFIDGPLLLFSVNPSWITAIASACLSGIVAIRIVLDPDTHRRARDDAEEKLGEILGQLNPQPSTNTPS